MKIIRILFKSLSQQWQDKVRVLLKSVFTLSIMMLCSALFSNLTYGMPPLQSTDYQITNYGFGSGGTSSISAQDYALYGLVGEQVASSSSSTDYILNPGLVPMLTVAVPPAPTFTNPANYYNELSLTLNTGGNPTDTTFAIAISPNAFTSTTNYVQANDTLGSTPIWQTNATWGASGFMVIGLTPGTTYTVKVSAMQTGFTQSAWGPTVSAATVTSTFSFNLTPNTVSIGTLTPGTVITAPSTVTVTMSTNANGGGIVYVYDTNAGLQSPTVGSTITAQSGNLGILSSGYGLQGNSTSVVSGGPMEVIAPYIGSGNSVGIVDTSKRVIFDSSYQPVTIGTGIFSIKAKASNVTKAAPDYVDTITVISSGTF